ncbi:hypothetical protein BC828DRAFT_388771 [Blastocladiella britannica]|nr:hypothetical protein BC828DRAFT_388771 [Blastocladiella britannica]
MRTSSPYAAQQQQPGPGSSSTPTAPMSPTAPATAPQWQYQPQYQQQQQPAHFTDATDATRMRALEALGGSLAPRWDDVSGGGRSADGLLAPPMPDTDGGDSDSDMGAPMLADSVARHHRPPSDFGTISRHLSMPRGMSAVAEKPLSAEEARAAQADAHIQRGIVLHEKLELAASTAEFGSAAHLGSPTGMYLYGMALRSGWGVDRDEPKSFVYLSRAAELAMRNATAARATKGAANLRATDGGDGSDPRLVAAARELTLAIYELGQSFRNGWGVPRDRKNGSFYLQIAADLGDPDAQVDVGLCYLNGDGVKRDKKLAAKYFRLASNSGLDFPGNSWVWKSKYDGCGVKKREKRGAR